MDLKSTIPQAVLDRIEGRLVREAGFAAGPGFCAGMSKPYRPPTTLEQALVFLEQYVSSMRRGHLRLDDGTTLWFEPPAGFVRHQTVPTPAPRNAQVTGRTGRPKAGR